MLRVSTVLVCCLVVLRAQHDTDFRDLLSTPGDQAACGGCYGFAEVSKLISLGKAVLHDNLVI